MTDASYFWAGVLSSTAALAELRAEARLTAPKGWFAELALDDDQDDDEEEDQLFVDNLECQPPPQAEFRRMPPIPDAAVIHRVAQLFSGFRRNQDLEDHLTRLAREKGI